MITGCAVVEYATGERETSSIAEEQVGSVAHDLKQLPTIFTNRAFIGQGVRKQYDDDGWYRLSQDWRKTHW